MQPLHLAALIHNINRFRNERETFLLLTRSEKWKKPYFNFHVNAPSAKIMCLPPELERQAKVDEATANFNTRSFSACKHRFDLALCFYDCARGYIEGACTESKSSFPSRSSLAFAPSFKARDMTGIILHSLRSASLLNGHDHVSLVFTLTTKGILYPLDWCIYFSCKLQ